MYRVIRIWYTDTFVIDYFELNIRKGRGLQSVTTQPFTLVCKFLEFYASIEYMVNGEQELDIIIDMLQIETHQVAVSQTQCVYSV